MAQIILFDDDCPLCKHLAELAERRTGGQLQFAGWQTFRVTEAASRALNTAQLKAEASALRLFDDLDGSILEGPAAWAAIAARYPEVVPLGWLAQRLGLSTETVGSVLQGIGDFARRFCAGCGGRKPSVAKR